jgi:RNA polymerase sigma-70 factor, ECF subfamily
LIDERRRLKVAAGRENWYHKKMRSNSDDAALIERIRNGDGSAFEDLVRLYQDRIYNLCRHMLINTHDAEDAAQDTFVKAFRGLRGFRPDASLYTWLYRIAVNTCIDYKRRRVFSSLFRITSEGEEDLIDSASAAPSPERLYESKQAGIGLWKGLAALSDKLRTVIVLKELEELSYEEIADVLDLPLGTVKSRIARAREELKISMKEFS